MADITPRVARALRDLSDEKLVEAADEKWIEENWSELTTPTVHYPPPPGKKHARRAPRKRNPVDDPGEAAMRAVAASSDPLSTPEIARRTKLAPRVALQALRALREAGRVFSAGNARALRWAVTQETAEQAGAE